MIGQGLKPGMVLLQLVLGCLQLYLRGGQRELGLFARAPHLCELPARGVPRGLCLFQRLAGVLER